MPGAEDARLGRLAGRVDELSQAVQGLRAGQRQILLAVLGAGAAQIGLLVTLFLRAVQDHPQPRGKGVGTPNTTENLGTI